METRPPCRIVDSLSFLGAVPNGIPLSEVPVEPFDLSLLELTAVGHVHDLDSERCALLAAARGAVLVIVVELDNERLAIFLDELDRVSVVVSNTRQPVALSPEQLALLDALAAGLSLAEACRHLGLSRRSATRRLADARTRLGVSSTTEALTIRSADATSGDRQSPAVS